MPRDNVKYAIDNGIAVITLSKPGALNALDVEMLSAAADYVKRAAKEARCTILTGEGRGFCSGADLAAPPPETDLGPSETPPPRDMGAELDTYYNPLVSLIREHPHPFITAVNGTAAGAGCALALIGDMVIASEEASFIQVFRRIGLIPDAGSTYLLARTIGRVRAMEMMLMGNKVSAEKAMEWGIVNQVVPKDDFMPTVMEFAENLANGPSTALGLIRKLVWDAQEDDFALSLHKERNAQAQAGYTSDFMEGVTAFLEKRPAKFTGK